VTGEIDRFARRGTARWWTTLLRLVLVVAAAAGANPAPAQANDAAGATPQQASEVPSEETVNQAIAALSAELSAMPEDQRPADKAQALTAWQQARDALARAKERQTRIVELEELARTAPDQLREIQDENNRPIEEIAGKVDLRKSTEDLNADLEAATAKLKAEEALRENVLKEETARASRRQAFENEIAQYTQQRQDAAARLTALAQSTDPPALLEARRAKNRAEVHEAELALKQLDLEPRTYDQRADVLRARKLRADRRVEAFKRHISELQGVIARRQLSESRRRRQDIERRWTGVVELHPVLAGIYAESVRYADELIELGTRRDSTIEQRQEATSQLATWSAAFRRSRELVEDVGLTDAIGLELRNKLSRLPDLRTVELNLERNEAKLNEVQYRRTELDSRLGELIDIGEAVDVLLAESETPVSEESEDEVRATARDMLTEQRELVDRLIAEYDTYFQDSLLSTIQVEQELIATVEAYHIFIDERVLWIQSTHPIRFLDRADDRGIVEAESDVKLAVRAAAWLLTSGGWGDVASHLWQDLRSNWLLVGACALGLVGLVLVQPRLVKEMARIASRMENPLSDNVRLTLLALVLTIIHAGVVPIALFVLVWRLNQAADHSAFVAAVADGLARTAVLLFMATFIYVLCHPKWLGDRHFGWDPDRLLLVRFHIRWLLPVTMPLVLIVGITEVDDAHHASLGRFAFIAAMLALVVFTHRVLRPEGGILSGILARRAGGWLDRLRYLWFLPVVSIPLILAVAAAFGYFYTAIQLERRVLLTVWMIVCIVVVHALMMRWLNLTQRRLAIEQWRKRRAARAEQEKAEREAREKAAREAAREGAPVPPPAAASDLPTVPQFDDLDVASISAQTQRLVKSVITFSLIIGVVLVWASVIPALSILEDVELWHQERTVSAESGDGENSSIISALTPSSDENAEPAADGEAERAAPEGEARVVTVAVTMRDLLVALAIVVVTFAVGTNIPGLLEIVILSRLPLSSGARYAWVTIVRYALIIIGLVIAFGAIGITWNTVQWLAAAITVGLGFGLQEIFANFVSGLIILFERPIRVGDTVTVGNLNGTVAQIRMRATTILDWDRKELIIPNKEFVTGQVINWTLSDTVMRVKIPVGIAYGSDVDLAKERLLEVARKNAVILKEPAPRALFLGFGDSTLNFELRVFISHIDNYLLAIDTLNSDIDAAFRAAGIEIAFPQRDLRIRSIDVDIPIRARRDAREE